MDGLPPAARICQCGKKISGADTHSACQACLGLQHAQAALTDPAACQHCARLSGKSRRRRLARLASLTAADPMVGAPNPPPREPDPEPPLEGPALPAGFEWGGPDDHVMPPADGGPEAFLTGAPGQDDILDIDAPDSSEFGDGSISLGSDSDSEVDTSFTPSLTAKPATGEEIASGGSPNLPPGTDLMDVCRRAAAKLGVEWPEAPATASTSRYEGRRLPKAKPSTRQLLPVFPECLEEATRSWGNPLTAKLTAQGSSALDWMGMEDSGFSRLPPVEPLVASHLHPGQKPTLAAAGPTLPSKAEGFQSTLNERSYKAVATSVRALNASSLLLAYQAELQEELSASHSADVWEEVCVVTDLCLRLHRCSVQASGRAMALMVTQERARWLSLSSLSQKEKAHLLDVPVDPKGLFGPAVASMQRKCEEKKKEGEALQLCLPRKTPPPAPLPASRPTFAQAAARTGYRPPKRQPQQAQAPAPSKPPELKGAWARKPFATNATQGGQAAPGTAHGGKKKRRAT